MISDQEVLQRHVPHVLHASRSLLLENHLALRLGLLLGAIRRREARDQRVPGIATAGLEDSPVEETFGEGAIDVVANASGPGRLSADGDSAWIASECGDVSLDPLQACDLIK
jgi:hypothetical protein